MSIHIWGEVGISKISNLLSLIAIFPFVTHGEFIFIHSWVCHSWKKIQSLLLIRWGLSHYLEILPCSSKIFFPVFSLIRFWALLRNECYLYFLAAEDSNCDDAEYSSVNDRFNNVWLNPEVYYSYDACDAKSQDDSKLWNLVLIIWTMHVVKMDLNEWIVFIHHSVFFYCHKDYCKYKMLSALVLQQTLYSP